MAEDVELITSRVVDAGGIRTHYVTAGEGHSVVLLHGSGPGAGARANWALTIPRLAAGAKVLAPDLVGFGDTDRPDGHDYRLETWLDHVVAFLDAVGASTVSLMGNSWGGALAVALAARHPQRVDKLVLTGSIGLSFPATEGLRTVWGYRPDRAAMRRLLATLVFDPALVTDELVEQRYLASAAPDAWAAYERMFPPPHEHGIDAMAIPEAEVAGIPHPTLVVHGRDDRVVPMSTAVRFLGLIDRAELHVFGRCGHAPPVEHPDAFHDLVGRFLLD